MDFLFRQENQAANPQYSILKAAGIKGFLLKRISFEKDRRSITRKSHYHTSFEVHFIEKGFQIYECEGDIVRVDEGNFLILYPFAKHMSVSESLDTLKYAFTFTLEETGGLGESVKREVLYKVAKTPSTISDSIKYISHEVERKEPFHAVLIENRIFECITHLFRAIEAIVISSAEAENSEDDPRIHLLKQYIKDNIFRNLTVSELASYCRLSEKQTERIFERQMGCTVMEFVRKSRCAQIEKLLCDPLLSLKKISEIMNFNNEYHFNAFFKKYAGMTPGAYRKGVLKQ